VNGATGASRFSPRTALLRLVSIPAHSQLSSDKEDVTARYQDDTMEKWHETEVDPALQVQLREALGKLATQRATGFFVHNHVFSLGAQSRSFGTVAMSHLTFHRGPS
jgi:hypothetical protein